MGRDYQIRRAGVRDLSLLRAWRGLPHVARWWGPPDVEPVDETLRDPRIALWVAHRDACPFAFIQDYLVQDWPPHHFDILPPGSHGLDMHIGPPEMLGLGHGSRLLRQHVDTLFGQGVPAAGIDPHPDNHAAIAAFAKAGFAIVGDPVTTRWGRALLMTRHA